MMPLGDIVSQIRYTAYLHAERIAIDGKSGSVVYRELVEKINAFASGILQLGAQKGDRVAIWLPKQLETIISIYGCSAAGLIFVPVNPVLKPLQVAHIMQDSGARFLITSQQRLSALNPIDANVQIILVDGARESPHRFADLLTHPGNTHLDVLTDKLAALLYTSGSTGMPKGVMLSHGNIALGAASIAQYLELSPQDRVLSVMPLSFDYGLNQITSSFASGASVYLLDHLFAQDVISAVKQYAITGLGVVPPLWIQLAALDLAPFSRQLRYLTNTGGRMPEPVLRKLQVMLPETKIYLMYGLTEAFRSAYLPPEKASLKPNSVGQAIPFAELHVVRADGTETNPQEIGELVHAGPLVAQGYWQDSVRTQLRFKPAPPCFSEQWVGTPAVWSGDQFYRDEDGDLYFVGRDDEMIKTSGYRVSPTEIEEAVYATGITDEAVAFGLPHESLGQVIGLIAKRPAARQGVEVDLVQALKARLVNYMVPQMLEYWDELPRSANGKIDRAQIISQALAKREVAA
jgi:acyl-CoA ligase (AMP-forming) (exosortase A-associated)